MVVTVISVFKQTLQFHLTRYTLGYLTNTHKFALEKLISIGRHKKSDELIMRN